MYCKQSFIYAGCNFSKKIHRIFSRKRHDILTFPDRANSTPCARSAGCIVNLAAINSSYCGLLAHPCDVITLRDMCDGCVAARAYDGRAFGVVKGSASAAFETHQGCSYGVPVFSVSRRKIFAFSQHGPVHLERKEHAIFCR